MQQVHTGTQTYIQTKHLYTENNLKIFLKKFEAKYYHNPSTQEVKAEKQQISNEPLSKNIN